MTEDLNNFAQYATYSTYSTIFGDFKTPNKTQPLKRNPLEYYTKRNIDPPRTMHGDPTKILEPLSLQKQEKPDQIIVDAQIHHYANEIHHLCSYANNIFNPQYKIPPHQTKQPKESKLQPTAKQTMNYEQFQEMMMQNDEKLTNSELEQEFQQYMKFRQHKREKLEIAPMITTSNKATLLPEMKQTQTPQLVMDPLEISLERAKSEARSDLASIVPRKTVKELYRRDHKAVLNVEEITQSKQSLQRVKPISLTQLGQHSDDEIKRAVQALQRQKVK